MTRFLSIPSTSPTTTRAARDADDDIATDPLDQDAEAPVDLSLHPALNPALDPAVNPAVDPNLAAHVRHAEGQTDGQRDDDRPGLGVLLLGGGLGLGALAAAAGGPASASAALPVLGGPSERPADGGSPDHPAQSVLGLQVFAAGSLPDGTPTTRDGTVRVQGLEPGASWSYSFDGGDTWQPGSGDRIPGDEAMKAGGEGRKTLLVRQTDGAGNHGTAELTFDLDRTAPERVTLRLKHDTGRSDSDLLTSDPTVVIEGLETGAVLRVRIQGGPWFELQGNEIPASRFDNLQGLLSVDAVAVDRAGNAGGSKSLLFTLDTVSPPAPQLDLLGLPGQPGVGGGGAVLTV